jgi:hypothetical protein
MENAVFFIEHGYFLGVSAASLRNRAGLEQQEA